MGLAIHFRTALFDPSREPENPINPITGRSLLDWLKRELAGTHALSTPEAEDWGWYSELEYAGGRYLIGASAFFEAGDDPAAELEWVFQVERHRSLGEKIFGKNRMTAADPCFVFFKTLFERHPDFTAVEVG